MIATDYDRFAVVAFAPGWIVEDLRKVRAQCPPSGEPVLDAHVTVKGAFVNPSDFDALGREIDRAVDGLPPFTIRTVEPEVVALPDSSTVILPLEKSNPLEDLHRRLVAAVGPFCETIDLSDAPGGFRPHVTVVQNIPTDGVEQALRAIAGWRVNYSWVIRDIDLVGRNRGVLWQSLRRSSFGRPVPVGAGPGR